MTSDKKPNEEWDWLKGTKIFFLSQIIMDGLLVSDFPMLILFYAAVKCNWKYFKHNKKVKSIFSCLTQTWFILLFGSWKIYLNFKK